MPSPRPNSIGSAKLPALLPLTRNAASSMPNSRKRGREIANGDSVNRNTMMVADAEEEFIDVDMASAEAYEDDVSAQISAMQSVNDSTSHTGSFVPFYAHLGGDDFDDDNME
eukprot:gb/GEZJ01002712.1/.p4 GENE.gb/GEZJ01002712.1/~~gb/GEZJ01002712.1/.p4  ORF type:complete len:112 (-),score=23.87 gb/GEZJ01002712.1/:2676-3011(-)